MNKIYLSILLIAFGQFSFSQTQIDLGATADNTIYSDFSSAGTGFHSNGAGENFTTGKNSAGDIRRALIKFDLSAIPAGSTITAVTLTLTLTKSKTGTDNVSLYKLTQDWGEGSSDAGTGGDGQGAAATNQDATWTCAFFDGAAGCGVAWGTAGGSFAASASATTSVPNTFPAAYTWSSAQMKTDVQNWLNAPATNFGWIIRSNETATRTTNRFASRENSTAAFQPVLSVTYTAAAPVTLLSFNASETKKGNLLKWVTVAEYNNAYFLIEHSTDGIHFNPLDRVAGAGTSSISRSYEFLHQGVSEGNHFYRIAQTDINGNVERSRVVSLLSRTNHLQINIHPNPVIDNINLSGVELSSVSNYSVYSITGALVQSGYIQNSQVRTNTLQKGFYLLKIRMNDGQVLSGKFLKQ